MDFLLPGISLGSVTFAFRESSLSGQIIVIILFVGSIFSWSVMVHKWLELRKAKEASDHFIASFRQEEHPMGLFLKQRRYPQSPLYWVYESACLAVGSELDQEGFERTELSLHQTGWIRSRLPAHQIEAIRNVTERSVADQALVLEHYMGFLATAVTASPLLGLLGTVWGVMGAFSGMAIKGMATLSAVAPGVSAALLTTVVGLLVALPSSIGYNFLAGKIRELHVQMDNFADELIAEIKRNFAMEH
jgi:biopolymer transport protein TolQ